MRAQSGPLKGLNPTVAIVSKVVVILFVLYGVIWTDSASETFTAVKDFIVGSLKWYYIGIVAFFLFFNLWLLFSRYGNIRLGDDDDRPEFSYFSWFSMLFGAGMGIGLVFWSIAEPIYHFQENPFITPENAQTPQAAVTALRITFFHWGLHPWAIYVIVALALSYFAYRKKLPLTIRSALYPIIGDKIYGPWGHAADVLAIFGTVFGVATSLGLGVQQMNTGLNHLFGLEVSVTNQMVLIAIISVIATASVVSGVGKGVRILSELNLWLSIAVLAFLLIFGPTTFLLGEFLQATGDYIQNVIPLSLYTSANVDSPWQGWWTAFYWGWWIAWAPFVGMFIARISRGRTIREFVMGVLLVPTLLAFFWLTLFGGTALHIELFGEGGIVEAVSEDVTLALYATFDMMEISLFGIDFQWLSPIVSGVVTLLIATYFITSSDSGTLVVNTILSVGDEEPPMAHRVLWGLGEGAVAAVLLLAGGLSALQTASIVAALPFSIIILMMIWGLVKALNDEYLPQYGGAPTGAGSRRISRPTAK